MNRYQRGQNLQQITMPWEASISPTNIIARHRDKTRRCLEGKPRLLDRWLWVVGPCMGKDSLSTAPLHEGRRRRQAKTMLRNLSRTDLGTIHLNAMEGLGNREWELGTL
jgi:hypothetical protein